VDSVFERHSSHKISLRQAYKSLLNRLPHSQITQEEMDAYLDVSFETYKGIPELIEWCKENDLLFMINTTGMLGYFQRVATKKLLPRIPILSANSTIVFPESPSDPQVVLDLCEIEDKPKNTEAMLSRFNIPHNRAILLGDSGGDGPHFKWGAKRGAFLIGSMTKDSLTSFCRQNGIIIDLHFGVNYKPNDRRQLGRRMQCDFMDLRPHIEAFLKRR
jgi:hypothetical protein